MNIKYSCSLDNKSHGTMCGNNGKAYKTVKIGDQVWMAENLRETKYQDGSAITVISDNMKRINLTNGALCLYDNYEGKAEIYAYIYNWYAVADKRNIAPVGWRVPSDEDGKKLEIYLGMSQADTEKLHWRGHLVGSKLAGNASLWRSGILTSHSEFGTSGFSAFPGGYRDGEFFSWFAGLGGIATFWSATELSANSAWLRSLSSDSYKVRRHYLNKSDGFSIRLLRDE